MYTTSQSYDDGLHSLNLLGFEKALGDPSVVVHVNAADIDRIQDVEFGVIKSALSSVPRGAPRRSFELTRTSHEGGGGGTSSHLTRAAESRPATAPARRIKSRAARGTRRGKQ